MDNNQLLAAASNQGSDAQQMIESGHTLQKSGTQYTTAMRVQQPRDLPTKVRQLEAEAKLAGEEFYYGWGAGKDRIVGPSIGLAMAAARVWGNCVVDAGPVQDLPDAWVLTYAFIDLETGFTVSRQFRQSKHWNVYGKFDQMRKEDIRFQIGQSKAVRNVIINALPKWLVRAAMQAAQQGVRARIEEYIAKKGLPAAVDLALTSLAKHGVTEEAVLDKLAIADRKAITVDHVVLLRGDLYALEEGQDRATELYPLLAKEQRKATASSTEGLLEAIEEEQQAIDAEVQRSKQAEPQAAQAVATEPRAAEGGELFGDAPPPRPSVDKLLHELQLASTLKQVDEILVKTPDDASDEQVQALEETAEMQRGQIRARRK